MKYPIFLTACALLGGCVIQQPPKPQPAPAYSYQRWSGPGWYYGVYFSNEGHYRRWHRHHRRNHHHRHHRHPHHGGHHHHRARR